jgi:hypothetical protein
MNRTDNESVSSIDQGNAIEPNALLRAYLLSTEAFRVGIKNANCVATQASLDLSSHASERAEKITFFQSGMKEHASYFGGELLSNRQGITGLLSGGAQIGFIAIGAIDTTAEPFPAIGGNDLLRHKVAAVFDALTDSVQDRIAEAKALGTKIDTLRDVLSVYLAEYDSELSQAKSELSTEAAAITDEIDSLKRNISNNNQAIIMNGLAAGLLPIRIFNELLGAIDLRSKEEQAETQEKPKEGSGSKTATDISGLKAIAEEGADLPDPGRQLNENYQKLITAFQRQAQLNSLAAAAKIVHAQSGLFAELVPVAADTVHQVIIELEALEKQVANLVATIRAIRDAGSAKRLADQVRRSRASWAIFSSEVAGLNRHLIAM